MRVLITGGSRGIGLAIATKLAEQGASVAILAKTATPHPTLPGTIHTAAAEIDAAGGRGLPIQCDIRDEDQVASAVEQTVEAFGGLDVVINNASAISLTPTPMTTMKRFDLMVGVNARGTFLVTKTALPHLVKSAKQGHNPHVLTLCPPPSLDPRWWSTHLAYTYAKMGMSLVTLGHAEEFRRHGIGVNGLWPKTVIWTDAMRMVPGVEPKHCRGPQIMADAAALLLAREAETYTGNFAIDEDILREEGIEDFSGYSEVPGSTEIMPDLYLDA
ncbi:MAG: NAD(P)-dependent oxidoreductase [Deltaproteobacteria bacterium]|nr:MAG: NAD(P)-dependent oxidoreductase [Deltaproteobacteria bacterium]